MTKKSGLSKAVIMTCDDKNSALQQQVNTLQQRITELEAALQQSEKHFRALTDSAPVGIYLDDADGKAIYINQKCAELVGVPAEHALDFNWVSYLHPDDRDKMVSAWTKAFTTSTRFCMEYRWVHANGKIVWTLGEVVPIFSDDGKGNDKNGSDKKATLFIGTLTDITAQKNAEREKSELEAQLVQAQRMESIGRLAGGVAHDYNNMLGAIIGYSERAIAEIDASSAVHGMLFEILKAANRSADVTRQLLSFARKQTIVPKIFDLNKSVLDMFNMLRRLIGSDIELVWSSHPGSLPINMDPTQLDQVVVNLCVNARDAIQGTGKVSLSTATATFDAEYCTKNAGFFPGHFAVLAVSDTGTGIDKEILSRIFEPFFTTKENGKGTGLGLASVYGAIKQNGGFIDVHSQPSVGTIFTVYIPLAEDSLSHDQVADLPPRLHGTGKTILIAEDEDAILDVARFNLEDAGYTVLPANSPTAALQLANRYPHKIDLLITDVIMPEMNGRDLASHLNISFPQLKCLFISGYTANVISNPDALDDNVHFLQKPFRRAELLTKVDAILHAPGERPDRE
jgi:PAS domain S-box-containing protein